MTPQDQPRAGEAVELPELPRPALTYADHSSPAFSAAQMREFALAALRAPTAPAEDVQAKMRGIIRAALGADPLPAKRTGTGR